MKVHSRCSLLLGLLLVTVLVSPAFSQTRVVSLSTQFDGFFQAEFTGLNGIVLNGQTLSVDFKFEDGAVLESIGPVWTELLLQTRPHGAQGDYPYDQYVVFGPGTTAHLLGLSGQRLEVPMSDWNGGLTSSPALTRAVLSTPHGVAGGDMLAYPSFGQAVSGIHYDIALPNTGETLYLGRIGLRLDTRYRRIQVPPPPEQTTTPPEPPPIPPVPAPDPVLDVPPITDPVTSFAIPGLGAAFFTAGRNGPVVSGYGRIQPDSGSTSASGMVVLGSRRSGVLMSETIVPDVSLMTSGRIHTELTPDGRVTTRITVANPNSRDATIYFELRNEQGIIYRSGSFTLSGIGVACDVGSECNQLTRSLDEAPYEAGRDVRGTLSFTSSAPVSVFAIRRTSTGGGDYLMTPIPVIDLSSSPSHAVQAVPLFVIGEDRKSELVLINPTGGSLTGTVQFIDPGGDPVFVGVGGEFNWSVSYSLGPNSSRKLVLTDVLGGFGYGFVRFVPDAGNAAPSAFLIYEFEQNGITAFEVGLPVTMGRTFRMAVEQSPSLQIFESLAIANPENSGGTVFFSLTSLDGRFVSSTNRYVSGPGMILRGLESLFPELASQTFRGVLRITTDLPGISVVGLRSRYNERQQLLSTAVVPALENALTGSEERFFPYVLNGDDFTSDMVIFSGRAGQSSAGKVRFVKPDGTPLNLEIRPGPPSGR